MVGLPDLLSVDSVETLKRDLKVHLSDIVHSGMYYVYMYVSSLNVYHYLFKGLYGNSCLAAYELFITVKTTFLLYNSCSTQCTFIRLYYCIIYRSFNAQLISISI